MNTEAVESKKFMLIYLRPLTEEERAKIVLLTSSSSTLVCDPSLPEHRLIDLLAESAYEAISNRPTGLIIETTSPLTMLMLDENVSPELIFNLGTALMKDVELHLSGLRALSKVATLFYEIRSSLENREGSYKVAFGEGRDIPEEIDWGEAYRTAEDNRKKIAAMMILELDRFIVKK